MREEINVQQEPIIRMSQIRVTEQGELLESITVESPPASQEEDVPSADSSFSEKSKEEDNDMQHELDEDSLDERDVITEGSNFG